MDSKALKKVIRRYRAKNNKDVRLCDILINIKSRTSIPSEVMKVVKPILMDKSLHREYGIKTKVIQLYGPRCFTPVFYTRQHGNKTYFVEGRYFSRDPAMMRSDVLPF